MQPDFLFHYTSLDNLALILNSKGFLFNNLNNVDDLSEGKSKDFIHIGKYYFVSCWTDLEEESIPFWNMYTSQMKGVRIKMPFDFFKIYNIETPKILGLKQGIYESVVPQGVAFFNDHWIVPISDRFLYKVKYTDNKDDLEPKLFVVKESEYSLRLDKVGVFKSKHWKFQSEWRYIVKIFPITKKIEDNIISNSIRSMQLGEKIPFKNYLVEIDDAKFEKMTILLGPKHTKSERIIVESLLNKFNPNATLEISELHGRIK